jgi:methionyl-tRNA formyltransferase
MKILYLGYNNSLVYEFLKTNYNVTLTQDKIDSTHYVKSFDWIVSYGYTHIIKKDIINSVNNPIINLHISYLPYNRGADPNFWSWVENTKKGITIHFIDEGIDTGDILVQKEISFTNNETLAFSYNVLRNEIEKLFIENFDNIIKGIILPKKQEGIGTFHLKKDLDKYKHLLTHGWETPIKNLSND